MNSQLRKIDALGVLTCLGITWLLYIGAIAPHTARSEMFAQHETEVQTRTRTSAELARMVADLDEQIDAGRTSRDRPVDLADVAQTNQRLARINDLAGASGLEIDASEVGRHEVHAQFTTVPLHLRARGSFQSAVTFLDMLHDQFPDTAVSSLEIAGSPAIPDAPARIEVDIAWYAAAESAD